MERAVFINYRGEDSSSNGAWLYTELTHRFGEEHLISGRRVHPGGRRLRRGTAAPGAVDPVPAGGDRTPMADGH